ncbi:Mortality factor 4 protein 1 [Fasciola gigantica]|uniref:Mortality factor 4 protein 1 n=1 Tax=Fasciola gigantica TaxID=46835 RepID=A0A504YQA7_FASGI|nr:Mortality factor 4 protein 1 [Fasciola gigantica]
MTSLRCTSAVENENSPQVSMDDKSDLTPKYEPGEKILCFHGPLLYEAKCLDVKVKDDTVMYFVHYQGWNKNWDEWVTDRRMFKFNEEGLKKQKELEQQIKSGKKVKVLRKSDLKKQSYPPPDIMRDIERTLRPSEVKQEEIGSPKDKDKPAAETEEIKHEEQPEVAPQSKGAESTKTVTAGVEENAATPSTGSGSVRRRKGRPGAADNLLEKDDGFLSKPQLKVELPDSLKAWIVDDWDLITRQARLYELPAAYPISTLMVDFLQQSAKEVKQEEATEPTDAVRQSAPICQITTDLRHEFVAGLQHYFNLIVGSQLLYKFERLQYAELLKQHTDKRMSDIYGPMHVLRLFVKLREMVSNTRVDAVSLPILEALVAEFLQFLHKSRKKYFRLEDYSVATAEYQRRAMC